MFHLRTVSMNKCFASLSVLVFVLCMSLPLMSSFKLLIVGENGHDDVCAQFLDCFRFTSHEEP